MLKLFFKIRSYKYLNISIARNFFLNRKNNWFEHHVILLKGSQFVRSQTSKVFLDGDLIIGKKWNDKDPFSTLFVLNEGSKLKVEGSFSIFSGSKVYINQDAEFNLGSGYINHDANISCFKKIVIGHNVVISEGVTIRDSDNHSIEGSEHTESIMIENNVWVGINATILKGVSIGEGAVIAAGSLVNKDVPAQSLVAGVPAKVIKTNIKWG